MPQQINFTDKVYDKISELAEEMDMPRTQTIHVLVNKELERRKNESIRPSRERQETIIKNS